METLQDGVPNSANQDDTCKDSLRMMKTRKVTRKQPQGYNLGYFSLWWSRMDREGAKEAAVSKLRHEDAGSSARLRVMLKGCARRV